MTSTRGRRDSNCLCVFSVCLAFLGLGCADRFFDVRGVLLECGTTNAIPGAQGLAVAEGYSGRTQFTTDSTGAFKVHMNAYYTAHVTVIIKKAEYADLTVEYSGVPADSNHLQLCMNRSQ